MKIDKYKEIKDNTSYQALYLYLYLEEVGTITIHYKDIADKLGMDKTRVQKCLYMLSEHNYITIKRSVNYKRENRISLIPTR